MKIDVTQTMKDWDGKTEWTVTAQRCETCGQSTEEATLALRSICLTVLSGQRQGEQLKPEDRFMRFNLGMRIQQESKPDLSTEEAALLQKLIMETYTNNLIACQAHKMLEIKDKQ